jgi:4a-hydroxytetrahydrobiopterin dehydratase
MNRLDADQARALLVALPSWRYSPERGGLIHREYRFADFIEAFAFMTRAALAAEKRNHHPEWCNVYDRVSVTLTTHDADGLSMSDISLAQSMDDAYEDFASSKHKPTGDSTCSGN